MFNPRWDRRTFLKFASAATLQAMSLGRPKLAFGNETPAIAPTADRLIILWLAGGLSHTDTFDPKRYTPYQRGGRESEVISTFPTIDSVVDDIKLSEGLENLAQVMDRATVVRSLVPPSLGHILHARHQYFWHTGYAPSPALPYPHLGSVIAKIRGSENSDIPPFVHIGQRLDIAGNAEVKAFLSGGILGAEHGPINIPFPDRAPDLVHLPRDMSLSRFENRQALFKRMVDAHPVGAFGSDFHRESLMRAIDRAYGLIRSPSAKAFDLSAEPKEKFERYSSGGRFGLGCLLARRLVEAGTRVVEVTSEFIPFGNFDTHERGHQRMKELKKWIDLPIAELIRDLDERRLLDRTLVVVASEFSRASFKADDDNKPKRTSARMHRVAQYGLHHHFTGANCALLFGGGTKRGVVYGETSVDPPCAVTKNPIEAAHFLATIYRAMGIPHDTSFEVEKRPVYVTENGDGRPVDALFG